MEQEEFTVDYSEWLGVPSGVTSECYDDALGDYDYDQYIDEDRDI